MPLIAANYTVISGGGGDYTTIQACAAVAVAGDTCEVHAGTYDERVSSVNSGSSGNVITFKAETDCVSDNGTTIAGSCVKVRGFTVNSGDNYITIQGFEVTHQGMTSDNTQSFLINGTNVRIINNYIHDTTRSCIRYNNGSNFLYAGGNNMQLCAEGSAVSNTVEGPYTITAGVNDKVTLAIQGVNSTVTLTPGSRSSAQILADIEAQISGADGISGSNLITVWSNTLGPASSIAVVAVANDAYTTLGMTVGEGQIMGTSVAVTAGGSGGSTDVLIENNSISYMSDYFIPSGGDSRVVYRNNRIGPATEWTHIHIDGWQPGPSSDVLVEGNLSIDNNSSDNHFLLNSTGATHYIVRFNSTCRSHGGLEFRSAGLYFYNNTFYDNWGAMQAAGLAGGAQINVHQATATGFARNNIWYQSINPSGSDGLVYQTASGGTIDHDWSLWSGFPDPGDTNFVNADPLVASDINCNFNLQSGSPARDAGGPLTTVAVADGGSGTTLVLTDASYFQDGWAGVNPDCIAVGTVGNIACISSINYGTNTVTLATGITRSDNDSVWLFKNSSGTQVLYGSAPDLGAYEYSPPVYSHSTTGGTHAGGRQ